jgi:hypothetical protein
VKLTVKDIESILAKHKDGASIKQLASTCGVSYEQVRRIVKGERWSHRLMLHRNRVKHEALLKSLLKN